MLTNRNVKEAYQSPEFELFEVQTCEVVAASGDLNGGQIEDVNFDMWNVK